MERRALGASGVRVSALSLGSSRTFERILREDGIAVMEAAREAGIDFLEDARHAAGAAGRLTGTPENRWRQRSLRVGELLRGRAEELGTTPSRLAIAFALASPSVASVLFGATRAEQVREDIGALDTLGALDDDDVRGLGDLAATVE